MDLYGDEDYEEYSRFEYHNAAECGDAESLQSLIQRKVEAFNNYRATLPEGGPALDVRRYLDLDVRDDDECTPLHLALLNGHPECVRVLLASGAQILPTCEGSPPLHLAACMASLPAHREASIQAVDLLCQHGASVFTRDDNGRTALHWAALSGHDALLQQLLRTAEAQAAAARDAAEPEHWHESVVSAGVPLVAMTDDKHSSALHLAARYRQPSAVAILLAAALAAAAADVVTAGGDDSKPHEAPPHPLLLRNKSGHTPLHMAALGGCPECVAQLAAANPDALRTLDRRGHTPHSLARRRGHADIFAALDPATAAESAHAPPPHTPPAAAEPRTLIVTSPDCLMHHTCPPHLRRGEAEPPPENVNRLHVLVEPDAGILRGHLFQGCSWAEDCAPAAMTDVLRVHEWEYVTKLQEACKRLAGDPRNVGHLDADTAISPGTFKAALKAAGAVCHAVDEVMEGRAKRAFCAVRPPGHHAGPTGVVSNSNEQAGSHGFCLLNNVTIGAAYALSMYRHRGVRRVALLDFDVHHGNGTEACVINTAPSTSKHVFRTPYSTGVQTFHVWRPWFDEGDRQNILFASVQGYGKRAPNSSGWVYPGSGATCDTRMIAEAAAAAAADPAGLDLPADALPMHDSHAAPLPDILSGPSRPHVPEDPDREFVHKEGQVPRTDGPRIINVGVPGPGTRVALWHRAWRDKILPAVINFDPDLIIVSAGFDAHRKDEINFQYIGVREADFEWITDQIVQVANRCCQGRVVSVLEGGYRIHGKIVSAFSRSVAAHVVALQEPNNESWDEVEAGLTREEERRKREAKAQERERKAASKAARLAAEVQALAADSPPPPASPHDAEMASPAAAGGPEAPAGPPLDADRLDSNELPGVPDEVAGMAAAPLEDAVAPAAEAAPEQEAGGDGNEPRKRRRTKPVDYQQLDLQMRAEQAARHAAEQP